MLTYIATFTTTDRRRSREERFQANDIDLALEQAVNTASCLPDSADEFVSAIRQADVPDLEREQRENTLRRAILRWGELAADYGLLITGLDYNHSDAIIVTDPLHPDTPYFVNLTALEQTVSPAAMFQGAAGMIRRRAARAAVTAI